MRSPNAQSPNGVGGAPESLVAVEGARVPRPRLTRAFVATLNILRRHNGLERRLYHVQTPHIDGRWTNIGTPGHSNETKKLHITVQQ